MDQATNYLTKTMWTPEHWSKVDWSALWTPVQYVWQPGVTPFSQPIVPFATVIIYLIVIFSLQAIMKKRTAWNTNEISAGHNLLLTIWSLVMCVGTGYYSLLRAIEYGSLTQLVCEHDNSPVSGPLYFFAYWYYLSKYYELLDTIILCLRKRPLTLLHVYHHSVVILLTYLWVSSDYALYWWTVWLNTMVHVFMYFYFFLISLGKRISNSWKKFLTSAQIGQFCVYGIVAILNTYYTVDNLRISYYDPSGVAPGDIGSQVNFSISYTYACKGSLWILATSIFVNITILALFLNFFNQTYKIKSHAGSLVKDALSNSNDVTCKDKIE